MGVVFGNLALREWESSHLAKLGMGKMIGVDVLFNFMPLLIDPYSVPMYQPLASQTPM